jgi:HK97 family phage portal protein
MRDEGVKKSRAVRHPLYRVLHDQPNEQQTSVEFREMMQAHLTLRGNAYAVIRRGPRGVEQLVPLNPDRMEVFLLRIVEGDAPTAGRLGYLYTDQFNRKYKLVQDEVLHLRGLSLDGIIGVSPITIGRKAIELSIQSERHGLMWWKNAAKPGGIIKFPEGEYLDEDTHVRLKKSWREAHTSEDLYTVAIIEGGGEWQPMGISNEDSEWLDSRRFQIPEICRLFRVSPHMVYAAIEHGNTYANVEQSDLDFVKHTMLPWIVRWEQGIKRDLIVDSALYPKFSFEGLLRADSESRSKFYRGMWEIAVYSTNDIRELEDQDPVEGGDTRYIPMNFVPINSPVVIPKDNPDALKKWIEDIANRIASAEIRELERWVSENNSSVAKGDLLSWINDFWNGRHVDYITVAVSPIIAYLGSNTSAASLAQDLVDSTGRELFAEPPQAVLNRWRLGRAEDVVDLICTGVDHD